MSSENNKKISRTKKWSRRAFIGIGSMAGVGLVVGVGGYIWLGKNAHRFSGKGFDEDDNILNAWVSIAPDNQITIAVPRAEMGQGVYTSVPMIIAEELDVSMDRVKIFHPQPEPAYSGTYPQTHKLKASDGSLTLEEKIMHAVPTVATGGSSTIFDGWWQMRYAGATAKLMIVKAAANRWGVSENDVYTEDAHVINKGTNEKLTYGALAEEAKAIKVESAPPLKPKSEWKLMGKPVARIDIPEKVLGTAIYGIDARPEGLVYGAARLATYQDGIVELIENQSEIEEMAGVLKVVQLAKGKGAIVIAKDTWTAQNAAKDLIFKETGDSNFTTKDAEERAQEVLDKDLMVNTVKNVGNAAKVLDESDDIIEATYQLPYLAHACMEPQNATVLVKDGKATIWVGTQTPGVAHEAVAVATGLSKSDVHLNVTYLGGGFGRRLDGDFAAYAAEAANELQGTPVQVIYSREQCMKKDFFRPFSKAKFRAKLTDNRIEALEYKLAIESVSQKALMRLKPILAPEPKDDNATREGFDDQAYKFDNELLAFGQYNTPVGLGFWRSVGYSQGGFYWESFIDECAHGAGKDPLQFRRSLLSHESRYTAVLDKIEEISDWKNAKAQGKALGLSIHRSFFTICAQVVELTKIDTKNFKIDKVYAVVDCGQYVNPNTIEAQISGGINFGLSAALYGEITFTNGIADQHNFPQYDMVRLKEAPDVEVHIMENEEFPGGIGEPGVPPIFAAICNALYAASGERIRSLPLSKHGINFV